MAVSSLVHEIYLAGRAVLGPFRTHGNPWSDLLGLASILRISDLVRESHIRPVRLFQIRSGTMSHLYTNESAYGGLRTSAHIGGEGHQNVVS